GAERGDAAVVRPAARPRLHGLQRQRGELLGQREDEDVRELAGMIPHGDADPPLEEQREEVGALDRRRGPGRGGRGGGGGSGGGAAIAGGRSAVGSMAPSEGGSASLSAGGRGAPRPAPSAKRGPAHASSAPTTRARKAPASRRRSKRATSGRAPP